MLSVSEDAETTQAFGPHVLQAFCGESSMAPLGSGRSRRPAISGSPSDGTSSSPLQMSRVAPFRDSDGHANISEGSVPELPSLRQLGEITGVVTEE
jgi:hypothetical protein